MTRTRCFNIIFEIIISIIAGLLIAGLFYGCCKLVSVPDDAQIYKVTYRVYYTNTESEDVTFDCAKYQLVSHKGVNYIEYSLPRSIGYTHQTQSYITPIRIISVVPIKNKE